jgi:hypothetical protein
MDGISPPSRSSQNLGRLNSSGPFFIPACLRRRRRAYQPAYQPLALPWEHDGGAAFARDTLFPVEPLEPGNLLRMDVPNILDVAIHGPADLDAVGIDEDELGKEAVVLGRQAFAQTLEKDCAFAIRARLRLDMPKLLSIASAQHRAATT